MKNLEVAEKLYVEELEPKLTERVAVHYDRVAKEFKVRTTSMGVLEKSEIQSHIAELQKASEYADILNAILTHTN